jgi:hypothetical protein
VINDLVADTTSMFEERKKVVATKTILGLLPKERLQLENLICSLGKVNIFSVTV